MKTTRCPTCNTVFRVSVEQLEARQGKVRCGQCAHVFNALECIVGDMPSTAPQELPAAPRIEEDIDAMPAVLASRYREVRPETPVADETSAPPPVREAFEPAPVISFAAVEDDALPPAAPEAPPDETAWADTDEHTPEETVEDAPPALLRHAGWLWGVGIGFLLLGAVVQGAYVFRTELAMNYPDLRPQFVEWCNSLGCDMPLPRKSDLIGIEASELRPSPQGRNLLQLVATLRNRAGFLQAYPHLELTLTDTDDKPLARRVFSPREFLPAKADGAAGFPAGGDLALSLTLDTSSLSAAGYRIYVFYP